MSQKIYCVVMRGGTSKALFFHDKDLPADIAERDRVILRAFGSPDRRQIDGLGGANSSTSKVAVIRRSERPDADINYDFGQVSVDTPFVGRRLNCGNISSAVGPFAIDEGLIEAEEPVTSVRIFNSNTQKFIIAHVPVRNGKTLYEGDYEINGVPGTAARIDLEFIEPGGASSGKLLPSGNAQDRVEVDGNVYTVSLVDAANPVVFVRASELGLKGTELPWEFEAMPECARISRVLEKIRGWAAVCLGYVDDPNEAAKLSPELPKIGFVAPNVGYVDATGRKITPDMYDLTGRLFSMGKMIHAYMGTGTVCTMVAANTKGTVVNEIVREKRGDRVEKMFIGHPFGLIDVSARLGENEVVSATIGRTARRLMEGYVYVD